MYIKLSLHCWYDSLECAIGFGLLLFYYRFLQLTSLGILVCNILFMSLSHLGISVMHCGRYISISHLIFILLKEDDISFLFNG